MNKGKRIGRIMLCLVVSLMMVMTMIPRTSMDLAYADVGDTPAHDKSVDSNGDGTYTIELSVTGDADTEVETAANVNVLVIYDESSSMTSNNVSTNPNRNRADYAEDIMHDFIANLRQYQKSDDPTTTDKDESDNIQVALVGFGPNATTRQGWTSNLGDTGQGINRFFDDGVDGAVTSSHNYTSNNGTNWQAATAEALDVLDDADTDPTFVIFVTDGAPTAAAGETTINPGGDHQWTDFRVYYRAATTNAYNIQSDDNVTMFGIYAYGREADLLDDLIYYSNNGSHRVEGGYNINTCTAQQHNFGATEATDNYYNAADTAALTAAIEDIFQTIVEALGVAQVAISDGTTNQVTVGTDVAELLEVDESSYEYWLSIPVDNNNQFQRIDLVSGEPVTYTVSADGKTVTWPGGSVTVNGTLSGGKLKYEWTEANALYNVAPPEAHLVNGAVDWDLKDAGTLLDGVTYSVTFRCYPSQTTLDYVADIRNDPYVSESNPGAWGDLPPEIQQYIDKNGNLLTNTTTKLSWIDTREDNPQEHNDVFPEQDPVPNDAVEELAVSKDWRNLLEGEWEKPTGITLNVTRDDDPCYTVTLNNGNDWKSNVFISIGIMGADGQPLEGAEGHDFTFTEPTIQGASYKWEIDVPTVHPMLINNVMTMLVKVDEDHPLPADIDESDVYEFNDATYYVDEASVALTATNERRSSLNLTKVVEGVDAPADAKFPFSVTVENSLAPDTAPSEQEDPRHDSDYWVWFSVWDENQQAVTEGVEGATHAGATSSWYYAPSGTTVTIPAGDGYSIRFNNLPTDTTYTITEGTLPTGFTFESAEIEVTQGTGEIGEDTFTGGVTSEGTIEVTNTLYQVTYTNKYELIDINVDKVWDDNSDQDGIRPETLTLTLNGLPTGTTAPTPEIEVSEDGNTWTYTWKAVPRYDSNGNEIEYTVTEEEVPEGYTCEETTAEDEGTITNVHEAIKTKVSVEKIWDDANDQDGVRPDSVSVQLMAGDEEVGDPVTLNETNQWKYTWEELDAYAEGELIEYSVTEDEDALPEGYIATVEDVTEEDGYAWEVTNSYSPEETTASVTKAWDDADDQDGIRPDSVTLTLYADGVKTETTVTLSKENDWTDTVTGLDKYAAGEEIEYTWKEEAEDVPEGYEVSYGSEDATSAPSGGTVTNTHEPEETTASVTKAWDDADDQDGIRPTSIVLTLLADGEETETTVTLNENNEWSATVTGLDKYAAGEEIEYTWKEEAADVPEGYEVSYGSEDATSAPSGGTVTNTHEPEETEATVKKEWDDADNQDGVRPDSIDVTLLADGEETETTVTLSEDNEWTATITGLDKYAAGEEIEYTWEEDEDSLPEGYTLTGAEVDDEDPTIITLTNHREVELVNVTVEKVWDDNEDQDGKRPESVTVQLKADGEAVDDPVTLNEANEWTYEWENLEKYKAGEVGQEVEYTVEEVEVPTGYEADVTGNAAAASGTVGYIITNIHEPETINLTITKEWDDNDDQDGKRPDDLTVKLSDGETTVTLSESNDWSATVEGLPRYAAGEEIEYSWTEDGLSDDYELTDTATTDETDEETGKLTIITTLTNTHELEKTDVSVEKTWDDADDRDGIRPDSVTVTLLANGEEVTQADILATVELSKDNEWKYTWEGLYVYADGEKISYTVEEKPIDDYKPEITGSAEKGFTIKNIHQAKPEAVWSDPPVKKEVKGNPSKDETFTFQMKALTEGAPMPEGAEDGVMTVTITGSGEEEFGKMYFTEAGTYEYEISEVDTKAANYTYDTTKYTLTVEVTEEKVGNQVKLNKTETVKGGDGQIVFTNTYEEPPAKTGDTTIVTPYIVIGASSIILLLMLLFRRKKAEEK